MAWTLLNGGDHDGENWTPADDAVISGIHYNVGVFTITTAYNVYVAVATPVNGTSHNPLTVYATEIDISGTLHGESRGYTGGDNTATGSGAGGGVGDASYSGGGGGYGGDGGDATAGGTGGNAYGVSDSAYIQRGSGGGGGVGGAAYSRKGGHGGASISLYGPTITVTGIINAYGGDGVVSLASAGGGGSGGGVFLCGGAITVSGTINANGGLGGDGSTDDGGRGGGGRIKILYDTLNTTSATMTVAQGTFGGATGVGDGTLTSTLIGQCTATRTFGQTFQYGDNGILSKITLYVNTVNTSGDFTLRVWDDTAKSTELASKTVTISTTGVVVFTLAAWEVITGATEYYLELTPDATGDIELGVYGGEYSTTGHYYEDGYVITYFDTYHIIEGISIIDSPSINNTSNPTVECNIANKMLVGAVHIIRSNGTGNIIYEDGFLNEQYLIDLESSSGVTWAPGYVVLSIGVGGHAIYLIDTKYPIFDIPTLTSKLVEDTNDLSIKIANDNNGSAGTWYAIDDTIVNNVETEYDLHNADYVTFKGETKIWVKIEECTLYPVKFDIDIITIDVPTVLAEIGSSGNTYNVNQVSTSAGNCTIGVDFKHRKWT